MSRCRESRPEEARTWYFLCWIVLQAGQATPAICTVCPVVLAVAAPYAVKPGDGVAILGALAARPATKIALVAVSSVMSLAWVAIAVAWASLVSDFTTAAWANYQQDSLVPSANSS